jgi:hypothetical protein
MKFGFDLPDSAVLKIGTYIVILVIISLVLGYFSKQRLNYASAEKDLHQSIPENQEIINNLNRHLIEIQLRYSKENTVRREAAASANLLLRKDQEMQNRHANAMEKIEELRRDMKRSKEDFASYKMRYRNHVWAECVGEKLDSITTSDGKTYTNITIKKVSQQGLSIAHSDGVSLISPDNLAKKWDERFLWSQKN